LNFGKCKRVLFSPKRRDRLWCPFSVLVVFALGSFFGVKWPAREIDHLPFEPGGGGDLEVCDAPVMVISYQLLTLLLNTANHCINKFNLFCASLSLLPTASSLVRLFISFLNGSYEQKDDNENIHKPNNGLFNTVQHGVQMCTRIPLFFTFTDF
jgi:hypothetical protein